MKLIYSVVPDSDARALVDTLVRHRFRCTRFDSHGGFLRARNSTILLGVEEERLAEALRLIRGIAAPQSAAPANQGETTVSEQPEGAGRATIFVLDVDRYERM
jgi:uncharacterized protein YaaQ